MGRRYLIGRVLGALALIVAFTTAAHAELGGLWAVGESTKVRADQLEHRARDKNAIFDGYMSLKRFLISIRVEPWHRNWRSVSR